MAKNEDEEIRKSRQRLIVLVTYGAVLAGASLLLRVLTAGKYEVQTIDLIFLVVPLLVVALAQGKLSSLDLFGLKVDFADVWSAVGQTEIRVQVSATPLDAPTLLHAVDVLGTATKGSLEDLSQLIGRRIEALGFKLGHGGYTVEAVAKYFEALSDSLRVVVVNDPEGKRFAIYNAPELISSLQSSAERVTRFTELLNIGGEEAWSELAKLPGFVGSDSAITENTTKRDALATMETLNTDILPVVNEQGRLIGTIERSKLTAGLILAVTTKLEDR